MPPQLLERLRAARLHHQRTAPDLDTLVRGSIALHSTDHATPHLSARARIQGFDPAVLHARLQTADGLVRVNAMRNTVHVVHTDDLPMIFAATGAAVAAVGRRDLRSLSDDDVERGVDQVCEALDRAKTSQELKASLPAHAGNLRSWLQIAMGRGQVLRADTPHLRSNRNRYARTRDRVPGFQPMAVDEARRQLLLRAVATFGPLTVEDLAWWLPAPKGEVQRALASARDLTKLEVEGQTWWVSTSLMDAAAPKREDAGAWALPYEDAFWKSVYDRGAWMAPGLKPVLFPFNVAHWRPPAGVDPGPGPHKGANVSGEVRPSLWWAGRAVGRWEEDESGVVYEIHADIGADGRAAVEREVEAVAEFLRRSGL